MVTVELAVAVPLKLKFPLSELIRLELKSKASRRCEQTQRVFSVDGRHQIKGKV